VCNELLEDMEMNEYMALDDLTLRLHTEKSGAKLDLEILEKSRYTAKKSDCFFEERVDGKLAAYATIIEKEEGIWFVLMFNTHPSFRTPKVFLSLFRKILKRMSLSEGKCLQSNVYKENNLSVKFHERLGFKITKENDIGIEYTLDLTNKATNKWYAMLN
jgi:ribosomal protein S18 acetylase RimI-like enzyme